jgi:TPR repeat protein
MASTPTAQAPIPVGQEGSAPKDAAASEQLPRETAKEGSVPAPTAQQGQQSSGPSALAPPEQASIPVEQGSVSKEKSLQSAQEAPSAAEKAEDRFQKGKAASDNKNYVTALQEFHAAATQGHAAAQYRLGDMYDQSIGVKQDKKAALAWMRKAAEQNYVEAQYALGGFLCEARSPEANVWYAKAADQGFVRAQSRLGILYYYGLTCLEKDNAKAAHWFLKASDNGDLSSMKLLGDMYANGESVNQDRSKAEELYRRAIEGGSGPAAASLANLLNTSERQEDRTEAAQLYLKAIELDKKEVDKGSPGGSAEYRLAKTYEEGIGISRDFAEAKKWYRQAAEKGNYAAKMELPRAEAAERERQQEAEYMSQLPPIVLGIKCVGGYMQVEDQRWTMTAYMNSTDQQTASTKGRFVIAGQQTLTKIEQQLESRGIPQKTGAAIILIENDKKQATVWVVGTIIAKDASRLIFKETTRPDKAFADSFGAALGKKVANFSLGDHPEDCNVTELDKNIFDKNNLPHSSVQNGELVVGMTAGHIASDKGYQHIVDPLKAGPVVSGMTMEQVLSVRGAPTHKEVIPPDMELWHYPASEVAFQNGKVSYVK